jgi:hypothetical protein
MRKGLSILCGVALGIGLSQFPEYAQQYVQRLGGAVDELRIITEEFDSEAKAGGLTRQDALAHFTNSSDSFLEGRGASMERTFTRYDDLSTILAKVQNANPVERLQLLPAFVDSEIGARTLENFKPAVPVTTEGFLWGGAGLIFGYVLFAALFAFVTLPFRRRRIVYR